MANVGVVGAGPVEFTDSQANQYSIPLSAVYVGGDQVVTTDTTSWPPLGRLPYGDSDQVKALLANLQNNGFLTAAPAPSQKPAMIVRASFSGGSGNNVSVTLATQSIQSDPTATTFEVTATETDVINNLTSGTIAAILGTDTSPRSGLVHVQSSLSPHPIPAGRIPLPNVPFTLEVPSLSPPSPRATVEVTDALSPPSTIFVLEARSDGPDGGLTTVTFSNPNQDGKFTLTATWTKTTTGLTIGTVQSLLADPIRGLAYLISVQPPAGGAFSFPSNPAGPVTVQLRGGADGATPSTASATIFVT